MATLKTKPTNQDVEDFLNSIGDEKKRQECFAILKMMKQVTKKQPKMWGDSMVGFGSYHYKYATGQEGDWPLTGFSPRKQNITVYIMLGFKRYEALMKELGKYTTGKSCLYIKRLDDIDLPTLKELTSRSVEDLIKYTASMKR